MVRLLYIGIGGFLGAIARYLVSGLVMGRGNLVFPLGTLVVNVTGSFILGLFFVLSIEHVGMERVWRPFVAVGFLGAYTTFSTFGLETMNLIESGSFLMAAANILLSVLFSLIGVYAGFIIGRSI